MINRNRRIDPKVTLKKEDELKKYSEAIDKAESILGKKESEMWEEIQYILRDKLDEKDRFLLNFHEMDGRSIDIMLAERRELETFLNLFDTIEKNLTQLYKRKSSLELEIKDREKDSPNN